MPMNLLDNVFNRLNVAKGYHSGKMTCGVANELAGLLKLSDSQVDKLINKDTKPKMTIENTNKISLGQAGSP